MNTPQHTITIRFIDFEVDENQVFDTEIIPGDIEMSYWMVGLSMILPYIEPYVIKHSTAAQKLVADRDLLQEMRQFCQQEGQHYRQHALVVSAS